MNLVVTNEFARDSICCSHPMPVSIPDFWTDLRDETCGDKQQVASKKWKQSLSSLAAFAKIKLQYCGSFNPAKSHLAQADRSHHAC